MKSDPFEGRSAEMKKPTKWLASEDIMGVTPVNVTIEKCYRHQGAEFDQGRKEDVFAIKFKGKQKQLVLNSTNRKMLVQLFGTSVKDWEGKVVALTVVDCKMMGKMVKGIRIEPSSGKPKQKPASPANPPVEGKLASWESLIRDCQSEAELEQLVAAEIQNDCTEDEIAALEPHIEAKRKEFANA